MKKLMIAMGAAALLGAVHAADAGIVSSDIVGYATQNLTSGKFNLAGVTFQNIGVTTSFDLNDVTIANVTGGADENSSDYLQLWDPSTSGYTTFYKYFEAEYPEDEGWYDAYGDAEPVLDSGTAFWYRARTEEGKSITFAGTVESDSDVTVALTSGKFNLAINPFPVATDFNDEKTVVVNNVTGGADENSADFIQIWDPATSGYTTYYKYFEAEYPDDEGWYDAYGDTEPVLPAGTAFWYRARSDANKSLKFPKPY